MFSLFALTLSLRHLLKLKLHRENEIFGVAAKSVGVWGVEGGREPRRMPELALLLGKKRLEFSSDVRRRQTE